MSLSFVFIKISQQDVENLTLDIHSVKRTQEGSRITVNVLLRTFLTSVFLE